jgi:hypothetical protein
MARFSQHLQNIEIEATTGSVSGLDNVDGIGIPHGKYGHLRRFAPRASAPMRENENL